MDRRGFLVDATVAVAAFALSAAVLAGAPADLALREADPLAYLLLAVYCGSVAFRRSHPVAVVAGSFAAGLAYAAADYFPALTPVALLAVYTAAVRLDDRPSRRLLVAALVAGALFATVGLTPANPMVVLLVAGAWMLGRSARARRLYTEALEVKNRELEQAQHDLARQAVTEERLRIARELHDVVAHSMSVVAVHAGTGRMVAAADAAAAERALETIETTTHTALREMRQLLGVLRGGGDGQEHGALGPAPGLGDLGTLVAEMAKSGLDVELRVHGDRPSMPPGVDLSAYRVVQEALTNVLKHAGASKAVIGVRYSEDDVTVSVVDDGRGLAGPTAGGHGAGRHAGTGRAARRRPGDRTGPGRRVLRHGSAAAGRPLMSTITVAVVDDQPLIRTGLRTLLEHAGDIEIVGEAGDGDSALALVRRHRPDVVLMDIRMPVLDGIEATRRITADAALRPVRVVVLTTFDLDEYVYAALRAGASGFLLKDQPPEEILAAIRVVAAGDALLTPRVTRRLIEEFAQRPEVVPAAEPGTELAALTDREREVLALVGRGLANAEIAERLYVSPATAKTHVSHIMTKLYARDRAQLVVMAYESGLVRPGV